MPWKQDLRSIQEMEDKENIPQYPDNISDLSTSQMKASQSIKRTKKKGFNLRKSLAWNPAFFTEEGNFKKKKKETRELSLLFSHI
jgi:hypothetical protein